MARTDSLIARRWSFLTERRVYRDAAALALPLYFVVRASVIDRPELALDNARAVVDAEETLGIYVERAWQQAILDDGLAVRFFHFVYFWLDFPLITVLGLVLY